jgi:hypothetical protein
LTRESSSIFIQYNFIYLKISSHFNQCNIDENCDMKQ